MRHVCAALALGLLACGSSDYATESQAMTVCADGETVEGIDVSYYQGNIDWNAVQGAGIQFGIARINDGGFLDPEFGANWQAMKDLGMIRGAYQFFRPANDIPNQAQVVIDAVGMLGDGDLPAVIDVEDTDGVGPAQMSARIAEWVDLVEAGTGKPPIVYTGSYFWNDNVGTSVVNDHPLWIAHYTTGCPNLPDAWADWAFHQYTSSGSVPGIAGNVDRNVWNGSLSDLQAFAAGPATQTDWAAEFVSLSAPKELGAGETGTVRIVLKNVGLATWDASTRLGTTDPRDRESPFEAPGWLGPDRPAAVEGTVPPGETFAFEFEIVAPTKLGPYVEHVGVVQEGVAWFADQGGPADDFLWYAIEVVPHQGNIDGQGGNFTGGGPGCGCAVPANGSGWGALLLLVPLARRRRKEPGA